MRPVLRLVLATLAAARCSCEGIQPASRRLALPEAAAFPAAWTGLPSVLTVTVRSTGTGRVTLADVTIAAPPPGLALDPPATRSLAGGDTLDLVLRWTPAAPGPLDATLLVTTDLDEEPVRAVAITGTARVIPPCDDGNPCTDDPFDADAGTCRHPAREGACDDGNACTTADRCDADALCRGTALRCDDDDACTLDLCDPLAGCRHPPDTTRCDDTDPCTRDTCDRTAGCAHPPADDGTACGPFDCATARLCAGGTCRTLDVSGRSDGLPCEDGDRCTTGDTCESGRCRTGTRVDSDPSVAFRIDLVSRVFGAAFDGPRIAVAGPDLLVLAVAREGRLDRVGHLSLPGLSAGPVSIGNGRFVVVVDGSVLAAVDATHPEAPLVEWSVTPAQSGFGTGPIIDLVRVPAGLVLYVRTMDTAVEHDRLMLLPLDATPPATGTLPLPIRSDDPGAEGRLTSDGARVLLSRVVPGREAELLDVGPDGLVDDFIVPDCAPCTLVRGGVVGWSETNARLEATLRDGDRIDHGALSLDVPRPLALVAAGARLLLREPSGVHAWSFVPPNRTVSDLGALPTFDDGSSTPAAFFIAPGLVLLTEDGGLGAFTLDGSASPNGSGLARVDAWGLASPRAFADTTEFSALAAGTNTAFAIDAETGRALAVPGLDVDRLARSPWVLEGRTRSVVVRAPDVAAECSGWIHVGPVRVTEAPWCGGDAGPGSGFVGAPAGVLFATTSVPARIGAFVSGSESPTFLDPGALLVGAVPFSLGRDASLGLRVTSEEGDTIVALRLGPGALDARARLLVASTAGAAVALDRDALLVAAPVDLGPPVTPEFPVRIDLFDLAAAVEGAPTPPAATLALEAPGGARAVRLVDSRGGRAWLAIRTGDGGHLVQVGYDAGRGTLLTEGRLDGLGDVLDAIDLGPRLVARTRSALIGVVPACR